MHYSTPALSPSAPVYRLFPASTFWDMVPECQRADLLNFHLKRAFDVVTEYRLPLPNTLVRFELVVILGVEAEYLFFGAAAYEPSSDDLDRFFADFLRRALQPYAESLP